MRINKYVALATGLSRRAADATIAEGRVQVNKQLPTPGQSINDGDMVLLDSKVITIEAESTTILLHKPVGYVVSRNGQGSRTIYDLLPASLHHLKPVGRLDKDSSGLLLMTNNGDLAQQLTHPSHQKRKVYEITLDKPLQPLHRQLIADRGIQLNDGLSRLGLERQVDGDDKRWVVYMSEGRNRQIRRTFDAVGYTVTRLHRVTFGDYSLESLAPGSYKST